MCCIAMVDRLKMKSTDASCLMVGCIGAFWEYGIDHALPTNQNVVFRNAVSLYVDK